MGWKLSNNITELLHAFISKLSKSSSKPSLEENESDMKNLKRIYFVSPQDLYKEMFSLLFKILLKD